MRRVRYSVAMSLDGYIAGPDGSYDWLPTDVGLDWGAFMARFDTMLVGRRTYEVSLAMGAGPGPAPMRTVVFSRTLDPALHPEVTVVAEDAAGAVAALRREEGKEIWLMGGGGLFSSLIGHDAVDVVEVAVVPILLGGGIPFLPGLERRQALALTEARELSGGVVLLTYDVTRVG